LLYIETCRNIDDQSSQNCQPCFSRVFTVSCCVCRFKAESSHSMLGSLRELALPALVQVVLQTPVTKNQPSQDLDRSTGKQTLWTVQMQDFFVMRGGQDHARGTKHRLRNFVGWINAWCCGLLMTVCWRFYLQRHGCKSKEKTPQIRRLWRHTS